MSLTVRCPSCQAGLRVAAGESSMRSRVRCASCRELFVLEGGRARLDRAAAPENAAGADAGAAKAAPTRGPRALAAIPPPPLERLARSAAGGGATARAAGASADAAARLFADDAGAADITLRDYWSVVRRRLRVLVSAVIAVLVATLVFTYFQEPIYRATTTVIVEPDMPELAGLTAAGNTRVSREFYETQWGIIRSATVLRRVVDSAGLEDDPYLATGGDVVPVLRKRISVNPIPDSRLVRLRVEHERRDTAIMLADTLASAYIEYTMEDRRTASRNTFDWLSQQIDNLRGKVESSERALLEFRDQEDVVSLERRQELVEERLASLSNEHNDAMGRSRELAILLQEVDELRRRPEMIESLPRTLDNPLIQRHKQELSELRIDLASKSRKYKPKHPEITKLQSQIGAVKSRLAEEATKIHKGIEIEHRLSESKEASVRESLDQAKASSMRVAQQAIRYRVLERESNSNRQIYDVLLKRLQQADIGGNVSGQNIRVLNRATSAPEPYKPRTLLNLAVALIGGLVAGVGLCFLAEHVDNTIKDDADVTQYLQETLLGLVPRQKGKLEPGEPYSEPVLSAYNSIRTTLRLYARDHVLETLLVTSALRSEGKTVTSACLAEAFARSGLRVLLIDTDMFQASLGKRLRVRKKSGLSDYFLRGAALDDIIHPTNVPSLEIIPAGLIPPNPAEPLGSARMQELIDEARSRYDLVVLDSPPLTAALDVAFLSAVVDGTVVVVRANSTPRALVKKTIAQLRSAQGNILGVTLVAAEIPPEAMGSYYSYEYQKAQS